MSRLPADLGHTSGVVRHEKLGPSLSTAAGARITSFALAVDQVLPALAHRLNVAPKPFDGIASGQVDEQQTRRHKHAGRDHHPSYTRVLNIRETLRWPSPSARIPPVADP